MRVWPLHFVFALILIGSLAAKARTTDVLSESTSLEAAVIRVARSQGLAYREHTTIADTDIRALAFDAPACSRPIFVVFVLVTFDQASLVRSAREPHYAPRYVYIDRSWDKPHRLAVFMERMKYVPNTCRLGTCSWSNLHRNVKPPRPSIGEWFGIATTFRPSDRWRSSKRRVAQPPAIGGNETSTFVWDLTVSLPPPLQQPRAEQYTAGRQSDGNTEADQRGRRAADARGACARTRSGCRSGEHRHRGEAQPKSQS